MKGLVDIHCHMLQGVDDGAKTIEETIKMVSMAYKSGIRKIICTPHYHAGRYRPSREKMEQQFALVKKIVEQASDDICLYRGREIYYEQDVLKLLEEGVLCTLADSNYVLIEFPTEVLYNEMKRALQSLVMGGYAPIVAHAERYDCLLETISRVKELIDGGMYIQVNAFSVTNGQRKIKRFIHELIKKELLHFVATDAHDTEYRPPELMHAYDYIAKKYNVQYADELMIHNPERIIKNEYI